ncbi:MAG: DNA cytosine methyltransferase [bacterium]
MENLTVIELFAGAGGLALGLERAGFISSLLVDNDNYCIKTLKHNRPEWNVVLEDVSKMDFTGMKADVVVGGFPCQSFSHAGKGLGFEDTRGTMFFHFARCVKEVNPKMFIAENVEGLVRHDNGKTLSTIVGIMKSFGYNVKYKVLNAVNYGVPQKRKRVFIVGTKNGLQFEFPEPNGNIVTIKKALEGVPESSGISYSKERFNVLKLVPPGGSWVDLPREIQREYMGKSFFSGGGRRGMARRLSWDEPCLTLTTSPSQKFTERCHPDETRPFTVREYARIQSFPDSWDFLGGIGSQYRQIGNAVPVKLAEEIGKKAIECLNNKKHSAEKSTPEKINQSTVIAFIGNKA